MAKQPKKGSAPENPSRRPPVDPAERAPRQLVVMADPAARLRAGRELASEAGADTGSLARLLQFEGAEMAPLFGPSEERLRRDAASFAAARGAEVPDLSVYYRVEAPDDRLDALAERLLAQPTLVAAYVKPPAEPAQRRLNDMAPAAAEAPATTADFTSRQGYLDAAPGGIDARFAWTKPGGGGAGVRIIDIEGAWRFSHEDLVESQGGVIGGVPPNHRGWRNHGTAVLGEFSGDRNGFGVAGICPDANVRAISIFGVGSSTSVAVRQAADALSPGDIILIEVHLAGPRFNFEPRNDQLGYIAVEWWPDDFDAIRYATSRGVIVVEAAGNGAENLDDFIYGIRPAGFPPDWRNPFNRANRDSGAIMVGAGAPPPGTHGRDNGPDRSRLDFSNYGALVDVQGWGLEVTTCGYGDLQGGRNEDLWYTDQFGGTSSASPIVVGALACVQGALRGANKPLLTPATARDLLRTSGSPQQDAPSRPASQRIGNRPNLQETISRLVPPLLTSVPLHRYWNPTIGDHLYTTNFNELGTGRAGYRYERIQCYVMPKKGAGTVPLRRYWNPQTTDHFYTTRFGELGTGRAGYILEGVQCHVYNTPQADRVPLHRYYRKAIGNHFYTTDFTELGTGRFGYKYEGIQCYVFAQQIAVPASVGFEETEEQGLAAEGFSLAGEMAGLQAEDPELSSELPETFAAAWSDGDQEDELSDTFEIERKEGPREVTITIKF